MPTIPSVENKNASIIIIIIKVQPYRLSIKTLTAIYVFDGNGWI